MAKIKFSDQPVVYEKAIKSIIGVLVLFAVVEWTDAQIAGVFLALEAMLGVLIWKNVTPNGEVKDIADAAVAAKEVEVTSYLEAEQATQEADFLVAAAEAEVAHAEEVARALATPVPAKARATKKP